MHHRAHQTTSHPRRAPRSAPWCACALLLIAASALGDDEAPRTESTGDGATATLIDRELRVRSIRLVGMDDVQLTVIDERGERRVVPVSELIALVPVRAAPNVLDGIGAVVRGASLDPETLQQRIDAGKAGFVETTDGERIVGEPGTSASNEEEITWVHPRFGPVKVDIDRLAVLAMPSAGSLALTLEREPQEDVLHLLNGDRIRGLITSLADPFVIEQADDKVEVTRDRIAGAAFANPAVAPEGMMAWLEDGTVIRLAGASSIGGADIDLELPSGAEGAYSMAELRALGFDAHRLVPLSDLTPITQERIGDRRVAEPIRLAHHPDDMLTGAAPSLGALDVQFPGPMRVEWILPKGIERIAATAALAPDTAPWGDCEIIVLVDGREIFRDRLEAGRPVISINEPVRGESLTIAIEPGNYGPINDRVTLHRPLLLRAAPR